MGVLVTLFEYSPLFYVALVSLCFVVTAAVVLGRFGFDVPVILRSSDDSDPVTPTPEKSMVRVTNPFALELGRGPASVTDGVALRPVCLEPCVLSCFWGCQVSALQGLLQAHQHQQRLSSHQDLLQVLDLQYHHCQRFHISSQDTDERRSFIPSDLAITDFGPLPRQRYPLVAVLTTAGVEDRNDIVASVTVVHVPDNYYKLSARILFQYLLTSQGNVYELKPLFMSADPAGAPPEPQQSSDPPSQEGDWSEGSARDCVICQNGTVNRVLLPCRHACVCDRCVTHFQHCPICRAFVMESFVLQPAPP
ncbi:cell growth regulator with RING finger domain protein 1 isoform X2 [Cololabis saira]|uniref:cell growth regulator with RING finger domain protein 1 isoform X2 n=1 Tax=Cololabis saira TaxID=129043 RepID=UPI002AD4A21E|nr:cell growth regulator with RING finger domain protein 1 isoform X2 [Cololabis saira]